MKDTDRQREYQRRWQHRKRGTPADPPPGYIGVVEVARRLHYGRGTIWKRAKRGDYGPIWRRSPRGDIYIREEAIHGR